MDNVTGVAVGGGIAIVVLLVAFVLGRELVTWYFKINEISARLGRLEYFLDAMNKNLVLIAETLQDANPEKAPESGAPVFQEVQR